MMNQDDLTFPFSSSRTLVRFTPSLSHNKISFASAPFSFSDEILQKLVLHWQTQLDKKRLELREKKIDSEIKAYSSFNEEIINALFVNDKPVMWPGKCLTLREWNYDGNNLTLSVSEITYPFIAALGDAEFQKSVADQNLKAIRPPLAVCTFGITTDQMLVLTVRGKTTNVYPGRFYGQGGNPASVHFSLFQHQLDELNEELLLSPDEVIHDSLQFYGIIEDCEAFPRKPDLIGTVQIKLSSQELSARFYSRPSHQRPPDVADIRLIPFNGNALRTFLDSETQPTDFCPPAHGGLLLIGQHHFGKVG